MPKQIISKSYPPRPVAPAINQISKVRMSPSYARHPVTPRVVHNVLTVISSTMISGFVRQDRLTTTVF